MSQDIEHVKTLIIGSGPAGYTAAIYAARADMKPVMYQGLQPGGQLTITTEVDNFPGYRDGVKGPDMMEDLRAQAMRFGTDVRFGLVTETHLGQDGKHSVVVDGNKRVTADSVIISTGASAKWLGIPSEEKFNGFGVSACAVCDGFFFKGQEVAIVGGGDTAAEEASYLSKLCTKVYMLVRKGELKASKAMQHRVMNTPNIVIMWHTETVEILGNQSVEAVRVRDTITGNEQDIAISGFFVAIGHTPNTDIFKGQLDMDSTGYLVVKPGTTFTNIPGVFASGDAADKVYRQAVTAAGTGCMAALDAERYLAEHGLH